jgi:hypothetical protein
MIPIDYASEQAIAITVFFGHHKKADGFDLWIAAKIKICGVVMT